jgi:hypothetical protein
MLKLSPIFVLSAFLDSGVAASASSPLEQRTAAIATRYLYVWSFDGLRSVRSVRDWYERAVSFYGQTYTHHQLMSEKRRAILRWPIRHYAHRPGTMRIKCGVADRRCTAWSIIDFHVSNPRRGTAKRGSAKFALGISVAGKTPRIFREGGSVISRRVGSRAHTRSV